MSRTGKTKAHASKEVCAATTTSSFPTDLQENRDQSLAAQGRTGAVSGLLAEIKGLGTLKDGAYSVDFENTVENMAQIISNMESQLDQVLSLNSVLKDDLHSCKEIIVENRVEKTKLEEKISRLLAEMPSKRELQMEIDQLIDDRSNAQNRIHELNASCSALTDTCTELRKQITKLEVKNEETVAEINYLKSRQDAAREQNSALQGRIKQLKQEKINYQRKVIDLQEECQRAMEEKYALLSEIRQAQETMKELRSPGAGRGVQSKWPLS
jgi:chromosome segregation ATPase